MKQNINLITLKLILIIILVILIGIVWSESKVALDEVANEQQYVSKIMEDSPKSIEPVIKKVEPKRKAKEEYFYAKRVFKYFTKRGFTKEATAGIIGNMMIETSGGSLELKPKIYSRSGNYYGLCQWSKKYYPEAHGLSFKQQLNYLYETMPWEFKTFGWLYKDNFSLKDFRKMTNVKEAAIAFTKVYERCSPASHKQRQQAALKAYNYFKALK